MQKKWGRTGKKGSFVLWEPSKNPNTKEPNGDRKVRWESCSVQGTEGVRGGWRSGWGGEGEGRWRWGKGKWGASMTTRHTLAHTLLLLRYFPRVPSDSLSTLIAYLFFPPLSVWHQLLFSLSLPPAVFSFILYWPCTLTYQLISLIRFASRKFFFFLPLTVRCKLYSGKSVLS